MRWWNRWKRRHDSDALRDAKERLERVLADDSTVDEVTARGRSIVRENGLVWNIEQALKVRRG